MSEIQQLFNKYINNQCSPEEVKALMMYLHTNQQEELSRLVLQELEQPDIDSNAKDYEVLLDRVYQDIQAKIHQDNKVSRPLWYRIAAAASILLCLSIGFYFYGSNSKQQQLAALHKFKPGSNKAILTLANGQNIVLTDAHNGHLATQGTATVDKIGNGQIVYNSNLSASTAIVYNTVSTPRGGQYHLTLADGTNVWLNAASSITYPTAFTGKDRQVAITGEAYFEVAHNAAKPFRVTSNGQTVEVLGTHFNVNAYTNEANTNTTLLEGSVKITANGQVNILKPGQQSIVNGTAIKIADADVNEVVAWKEGYFDFTGANIKTVMRQLSRWYDVDIVFDDVVSNETYTGRIPRSWDLSQVIKIVQETKSVQLTIKGRRIVIKQ